MARDRNLLSLSPSLSLASLSPISLSRTLHATPGCRRGIWRAPCRESSRPRTFTLISLPAYPNLNPIPKTLSLRPQTYPHLTPPNRYRIRRYAQRPTLSSRYVGPTHARDIRPTPQTPYTLIAKPAPSSCPKTYTHISKPKYNLNPVPKNFTPETPHLPPSTPPKPFLMSFPQSRIPDLPLMYFAGITIIYGFTISMTLRLLTLQFL